MGIKENIRLSYDTRFLRSSYLYLFFRRIWLFLKDPFVRSSVIANLKYREGYYQRSAYTRKNRYPNLFAACAGYLNKFEMPRIISFGCATGEEVATLANYLPDAIIMGIDINTWCIKQCKKKYKNNQISFYERYSTEFIKAGDFDAIFCMAVFQRTENRLNPNNAKSKNFSFDQFEYELTVLDKKLKPGGLMVIEHADFSFEDTIFARRYKPLNFVNNQIRRNRPLFNKENINIEVMQFHNRVFIKDI